MAAIVYYRAKGKYLPRIQPDKDLRWDYDYVEVGDASTGHDYGLADIESGFGQRTSLTGDEWTVGSSSSVSSGSLSPVDDGQSLWEGETLASHSDGDIYDSVRR